MYFSQKHMVTQIEATGNSLMDVDDTFLVFLTHVESGGLYLQGIYS